LALKSFPHFVRVDEKGLTDTLGVASASLLSKACCLWLPALTHLLDAFGRYLGFSEFAVAR
jgi:hypothetical protein